MLYLNINNKCIVSQVSCRVVIVGIPAVCPNEDKIFLKKSRKHHLRLLLCKGPLLILSLKRSLLQRQCWAHFVFCDVLVIRNYFELCMQWKTNANNDPCICLNLEIPVYCTELTFTDKTYRPESQTLVKAYSMKLSRRHSQNLNFVYFCCSPLSTLFQSNQAEIISE